MDERDAPALAIDDDEGSSISRGMWSAIEGGPVEIDRLREALDILGCEQST